MDLRIFIFLYFSLVPGGRILANSLHNDLVDVPFVMLSSRQHDSHPALSEFLLAV